jgi:hypothetical protein
MQFKLRRNIISSVGLFSRPLRMNLFNFKLTLARFLHEWSGYKSKNSISLCTTEVIMLL